VQEIKPDLVQQLKARYQGKQSERSEREGSVPSGSQKQQGPGAADPTVIKELEDKVAAQGLKVRELKALLKENKADKAAVDSEVKILLELKQKLTTAQGGVALTDTKSGKKGKKK
jgi:hypothetical protein